ncbi:Hypothetical protein CINCED_3A011428 [Cinara cedri]|uniref:Uncharacterized protein n=1 Tax=Cinara cedri TaxID=506608 RepID=A0A5E4MZV2_9HEMI|nr:Hypothetical protein CINCED_3A011428 [Cinara cedri]
MRRLQKLQELCEFDRYPVQYERLEPTGVPDDTRAAELAKRKFDLRAKANLRLVSESRRSEPAHQKCYRASVENIENRCCMLAGCVRYTRVVTGAFGHQNPLSYHRSGAYYNLSHGRTT